MYRSTWSRSRPPQCWTESALVGPRVPGRQTSERFAGQVLRIAGVLGAADRRAAGLQPEVGRAGVERIRLDRPSAKGELVDRALVDAAVLVGGVGGVVRVEGVVVPDFLADLDDVVAELEDPGPAPRVATPAVAVREVDRVVDRERTAYRADVAERPASDQEGAGGLRRGDRVVGEDVVVGGFAGLVAQLGEGVVVGGFVVLDVIAVAVEDLDRGAVVPVVVAGVEAAADGVVADLVVVAVHQDAEGAGVVVGEPVVVDAHLAVVDDRA